MNEGRKEHMNIRRKERKISSKRRRKKRNRKADVKRRMKKGRQTNTSNLLILAGSRLVYHVSRSKMAAFIER